MGPLIDIQDNIEKLRSLQESLHDLCAFISTLDLTSGAKEDTLIHGINELKEAFANIDLSSIEQAITDVKNAVANIDFSTLAKEETLIVESQSIKDKIDAIPATDLSIVAKETTLTQGISEINEAVANIDLSSIESKVETEADSIEAKITEIVTAYNNGQEIIDQMVAIQLQTIIGDGD